MRLIDVDKLKERIENPDYTLYNGEMRAEWIEECIANAPTIEAKPVKHGQWIDNRTRVICSCCKAEYSDELFFMGDNVDYCPKCGAKMDGGSHEEAY